MHSICTHLVYLKGEKKEEREKKNNRTLKCVTTFFFFSSTEFCTMSWNKKKKNTRTLLRDVLVTVPIQISVPFITSLFSCLYLCQAV